MRARTPPIMLEEAFARGWENLIGRWDGPMWFRLLMQPGVAIFFAVRAGLRDARLGKPSILCDLLSDSVTRQERYRQVWMDVGTVFLSRWFWIQSTWSSRERTMLDGPKINPRIYVDRSRQQWVVQDREGNFWLVPSAEQPWEHRIPFDPTEETELEPIPGHYRSMLGLPF